MEERGFAAPGMGKRMELLAPGGDVDSIKAAILAGADAVYCGLDRFNARNRAENITFSDLYGILRLAHTNNCEVFLTLNIIIVESELPALLTLLNRLVNTTIDGVIVQDLGMFYLLATYFPGLQVHASTQLTTHNEGQIQFLRRLHVNRVNLSRELSLQEIKELAIIGQKNNILTEVFVHGSYCLSFSGICYLSSVHGGNSGNRGRCSQPCRNQYQTTAAGRAFPLNLKDNSAFSELGALADAGVYSLKIEGRIKKFHYVYTVVRAFREQLQRLYNQEKLELENRDLYKVFNRNFSHSFLQGDIDEEMFIDNPRDHSAIHRTRINGCVTEDNIEKAKRELYDEKTEIIKNVKNRIEKLRAQQAPLHITVFGKSGTPLQVTVKTPETSFTVFSESPLLRIDTDSAAGLTQKRRKGSVQCLDYELLQERFNALNETEYFVEQLGCENLAGDLFLPFKEITAIKKKILFGLNGKRESVDPIDLPKITKQKAVTISPSLSLLISSSNDLHLCRETTADIYFQLPDSPGGNYSEYIDLFSTNKRLFPWFSSILIGEDYRAALDFLQRVQPDRIVTNNTGIAYAAYQRGIPWIAGPCLNIVNSFSLLCLKEKFNCWGAFVSNELKRMQIKGIKKPDNFRLYFSIYHPIVLLTSRQCLFHQVTGCEKNAIDEACMQHCSRSASITDRKKASFFIEKTKGHYHALYNEANYLNTDIVTDVPDLFSSFFVDLRNVTTATRTELDKSSLVQLFARHVAGNSEATLELQQSIQPSTAMQYAKGI